MITLAGKTLDDFEAALTLAPWPPIYGSPFANLLIFACFALVIPPLVAGAWLAAMLRGQAHRDRPPVRGPAGHRRRFA